MSELIQRSLRHHAHALIEWHRPRGVSNFALRGHERGLDLTLGGLQRGAIGGPSAKLLPRGGLQWESGHQSLRLTCAVYSPPVSIMMQTTRYKGSAQNTNLFWVLPLPL